LQLGEIGADECRRAMQCAILPSAIALPVRADDRLWHDRLDMLTPAEELGLAGATLDARVRRAVNRLSDATLADVARRLTADARTSDMVYARDGTIEPVRIMLRPLLVMPDQLGYLQHVCSRIMDALRRLPDLYLADEDVRQVVHLAPEEASWLRDIWHGVGKTGNPLYGRLDAVCDFTSARWQDSLRFLEPNLSGVGGIHLGPVAESLVMRDVVPPIARHDPGLKIELPRDQRELFLQVLLDHAQAAGRAGANICLIEPKYVAEGPNEQSHLVAYFEGRRGVSFFHADPTELRLVGDEVYYEDARIDVAYRDYEIRDLLRFERETGRRLDAIRALFRQNRIVSSIGGDLDQKSCWELLTDDELAARFFSTAERQLFRRHILWTRRVAERRTTTAYGAADLPEFVRTHREELVLKPNRGYGGSGVHLGLALGQSEWDALLEAALESQDDPYHSWVVQAVTTLPVHLFPVVDETGRVHSEPFYTVVGFAATEHGLGIICRVSQKQVVNVAQRGGLAAVLIGQRPAELKTPRFAVPGAQAERELREEIARLRRLDGVIRVLEWDEETYRPIGAERDRGSQLALVEGLRHNLLGSDRLGDLIDAVAESAGTGERPPAIPAQGAAASAGERATTSGASTAIATARVHAELKRLSRLRRVALAMPERLVVAFAEARSACLAAWEHARVANDFALFAEPFAELLGLMRERAAALMQLMQGGNLYDAVLDEHEPGMRRARLDVLLREAGERLEALVPVLAERTARDAGRLPQARFPDERQAAFCRTLLAAMGFDFSRGRMDRSTHPFTVVAGEDDVRLTIRVSEDEPLRAIFATLHEGGHALYDQGFPAHLRGTLLADGPSVGLHEAQARLWENQVGRSLAFWTHYFPLLRDAYPSQLANLDVASFHRAINVVAPGTSRVAADEATYDLHILLRYELEIALLEGDLGVSDLPAAWAERSRKYLAMAPQTMREGCLQDVHWALGEFGYFPTYTIGNWYAAQIFEAYLKAVPASAGSGAELLASLRIWLAEHIYRHGAELDAEDLIRAATGESLAVDAFFRLLERRFGEAQG
jgi:carboxypeptidase Taq